MKLDRDNIAAELMVPRELYDELLQDMIDNLGPSVDRYAADGIAEGDLDEVGTLAHTAKGSAASLRVSDIHQTAVGLEDASRQDRNANAAHTLMADLKAGLEELHNLLMQEED
jgi:HPt (histidine-containing phosphotransfer) domain-containing protein